MQTFSFPLSGQDKVSVQEPKSDQHGVRNTCWKINISSLEAWLVFGSFLSWCGRATCKGELKTGLTRSFLWFCWLCSNKLTDMEGAFWRDLCDCWWQRWRAIALIAFKKRTIPPSFNTFLCKLVLLIHNDTQNCVCWLFCSFGWYLDFLKHVFPN